VSRTCVHIHVTCLDIVLDDLPIWADQSHLPLGQRHIDCRYASGRSDCTSDCFSLAFFTPSLRLDGRVVVLIVGQRLSQTTRQRSQGETARDSSEVFGTGCARINHAFLSPHRGVQKATQVVMVLGYAQRRFPEPSAPTGGPHQSTTRPPIDLSSRVEVVELPCV
jgi:hypothetical protein